MRSPLIIPNGHRPGEFERHTRTIFGLGGIWIVLHLEHPFRKTRRATTWLPTSESELAVRTATALECAGCHLPRNAIFIHSIRRSNPTSDPLVPKKGLGCRVECFQSHTVVLQPSHSCPTPSVWSVCKPSNGNPHRESIAALSALLSCSLDCRTSLRCERDFLGNFKDLPQRVIRLIEI
jgi:hypothetical protein